MRNALSHFNQVRDVSNEDRDLAIANIQKAAKHFDVEMTETHWKEPGDWKDAERSPSFFTDQEKI